MHPTHEVQMITSFVNSTEVGKYRTWYNGSINSIFNLSSSLALSKICNSGALNSCSAPCSTNTLILLDIVYLSSALHNLYRNVPSRSHDDIKSRIKLSVSSRLEHLLPISLNAELSAINPSSGGSNLRFRMFNRRTWLCNFNTIYPDGCRSTNVS